jgi:hypothetical protein
MGKQMEGDNKKRRAKARKARESGQSASEVGVTTGASKQQHRTNKSDDPQDRLAAIQRGEDKQAGSDIPRPLRGKGRSRDAVGN